MVRGLYGGNCVEGHHAYISDRGGRTRVAEIIDLSQITWSRRRDEISEASIVIQGGACVAQIDVLRNIEPKRHELVIFRGDQRVWEGPVNLVGWHHNYVEVSAQDVMSYVNARPLSKEWDNRFRADYDINGDLITQYTSPTEVTTRLETILNYELDTSMTYLASDGTTVVTVPAWEDLTPPANVKPHIVVHHFPDEVRTAAYTKPYEMTVGEHIDNYAQTGGIDYTVVGRAIHLWDVNRNIGQTRTLTEADFFGEIIVTAYGSDFAALAFNVAQDGRYGGAGENDSYYGPWAKIHTIENEADEAAPSQAYLNSQAQRNLAGRNPVPVEVRVPDSSGIRLSSDLTIDDLVPGVHMPLLATLNSRQVSQMQKLHKVDVTETSEGENIAVTLIPAAHDENPEE